MGSIQIHNLRGQNPLPVKINHCSGILPVRTGVLNPVSVDPHQTILKQIHPGNLILHFDGIRNPEGFPVYSEKISLIPHR